MLVFLNRFVPPRRGPPDDGRDREGAASAGSRPGECQNLAPAISASSWFYQSIVAFRSPSDEALFPGRAPLEAINESSASSDESPVTGSRLCYRSTTKSNATSQKESKCS
jgi:hypothetical protein